MPWPPQKKTPTQADRWHEARSQRTATPADQQAAYTDPSIPIDERAVEKIVNFFGAGTAASGERR